MLWRWVEVGAPADRVWDLLVDLDSWPRWGPTVTAARLDDGVRRLHARATGSVRTPVGVWIPFLVTEFSADDPTPRSWSWSVAGVPATTHRVEELDAERCRVGMGVPVWAPPYLVVVELGLRRIRSLAERG